MTKYAAHMRAHAMWANTIPFTQIGARWAYTIQRRKSVELRCEVGYCEVREDNTVRKVIMGRGASWDDAFVDAARMTSVELSP